MALNIKTLATSNSLIIFTLNPPTQASTHTSPLSLTSPLTLPLKPKASSWSHITLRWNQSFSSPYVILSISVIPQSYLMHLFTILCKHVKLNTLKTELITSHLFIKTYLSQSPWSSKCYVAPASCADGHRGTILVAPALTLHLAMTMWWNLAKRMWMEPWQGGSVGWTLGSQCARSLVQFPVRAHAWVVGSVLGWGTYQRQPINVSLSDRCFPPSLSTSLPLSKNKQIKSFFKKSMWMEINILFWYETSGINFSSGLTFQQKYFSSLLPLPPSGSRVS